MKRKWLAVGIILLFVCGALMLACSAQIITPQANEVTTSSESSVQKVKYVHDSDEEDFFTFAIIWGTFEVRDDYVPFFSLAVHNPGPWYNQTMHVIGYRPIEPHWIFKNASEVDCGFLNIGPVGFHRLFVIAYGNIAAFG